MIRKGKVQICAKIEGGQFDIWNNIFTSTIFYGQIAQGDIDEARLGLRVQERMTCLFMCPQCWRATDELLEFWAIKFDVSIIEERTQGGELRGINPDHKFL